jgi:hypothetical protein
MSEADATELLNELISMGMTDESIYKHHLSGLLPFSKIEQVGQLKTLRSMRLVRRVSWSKIFLWMD